MLEYMENVSQSEAENIRKTIQDLFRQTCILQTKCDPVTLIQKDNPHYQVCARNREFIADYLQVLDCELVHDPQEHIFRITGDGVLTERMTLLTTKLVILMKLIYRDKIMGEGVAFKYNGNTIYSPCKGKIVAVASTKHALGIETEDGIEILIHVGLETAEFNGNGFELLVNQNDKVTIGQPLLKIDRDFFETHHTDLITPVVVTSKGLNIEFTNKEEVTIKDVVMMINR